MKDIPRPRFQFILIWLLAGIAELVVLARIIAHLRFVGGAPAAAGMALIWNGIALIGIPLAAWFVTRLLRREYRGDA